MALATSKDLQAKEKTFRTMLLWHQTWPQQLALNNTETVSMVEQFDPNSMQ